MSSILEERLRRSIELIRNKVIEMGMQAEQATVASLKALRENNRQLVYAIILHDHRIDQLEKELDRLCLEFLVREQPVAGHLRTVYASIKINTELDRIGDYAESIARQVLFVSSEESKISFDRFIEIGELSIKMLPTRFSHLSIRTLIWRARPSSWRARWTASARKFGLTCWRRTGTENGRWRWSSRC